MRRKLPAEEGRAARHKELGPLMRLGHYFTSPNPPTLGFLYVSATAVRTCFTDLLQHEGKWPNDPAAAFCFLSPQFSLTPMTPMGFNDSHDIHNSHGCFPPMAQCYGDTGESLSATPQCLWCTCLRLPSSLRPSHSASSSPLLYRWHLHCGLMSPWAFFSSLFPYTQVFS